MRTERKIFACFVCLSAIGCHQTDTNREKSAQVNTAPFKKYEKTKDAINRFAVSSLTGLAKANPSGNIMISPWSLEECFGMARLGAKGETDKQLRTFLNLTAAPSDSAKELKGLRQSITALMNADTIRQANGIWVTNGAHIEQTFTKSTLDFFQAPIRQTNFSEPAVSEINKFVSQETRGRIPALFDTLDPKTLMALVNAVSFKDKWLTPFEKSNTQDMEFLTASGDKKKVPMMLKEQKFQYGENKLNQWVELYYQSGLTMLVVLPKKGVSLEKVLAQADLFPDKTHYVPTMGKVWIPHWTSKFSWDIRKSMIRKGFAEPFGVKANFSGISKDNLFISQAIQKTFIQVDEEGTEATAATGAMAAASNDGAPAGPFEFRADHPFAYFIWVREGLVYFAGVVNDPTK